LRYPDCEVSEEVGLQAALGAFEAVAVAMGVVLHDAVDRASECIEGEGAAPTGTGMMLDINLSQQQ
jgi:hypothetical protein